MSNKMVLLYFLVQFKRNKVCWLGSCHATALCDFLAFWSGRILNCLHMLCLNLPLWFISKRLCKILIETNLLLSYLTCSSMWFFCPTLFIISWHRYCVVSIQDFSFTCVQFSNRLRSRFGLMRLSSNSGDNVTCRTCIVVGRQRRWFLTFAPTSSC